LVTLFACLVVVLVIGGGVVYVGKRLRDQPFREAGSTLFGGSVATQDRRGSRGRPDLVVAASAAPPASRSSGNRSLVDALSMHVAVMGTGDWLFAASGNPAEPFKGLYLRVTVEHDGGLETYIVERLTSDEFLERKGGQTLLINTFFVYRVRGTEYIARGTSEVVVRLEKVGDDFVLIIPLTTEAAGQPIPRRIMEDVHGDGERGRLLGQLARARKLDID
jgi:hypothetical protein